MHERRIEIRWRDMDAYGHVNNGVYLNFLEEARDRWVQDVLGSIVDTWDFVLARVAIDFRNELKQDDGEVIVRCSLASVGRSSIRTREEICKLDGTLSAEAASVIVPRDAATGRSRPLTAEERTLLEAELARDQVEGERAEGEPAGAGG
jgi:acyl-CoA thioester hydrolase